MLMSQKEKELIRKQHGMEFLQSSGPRGAANQQRSLLGRRREMVEVLCLY